MSKSCSHMNADGTFKGGFDGCVTHMQTCEGDSEESAKKICGKIAADKASGSGLAQIAGVRFAVTDDSQFACAHLDTSFALALPEGEVPDVIDIQYMPPGRQQVKPFVAGEPMPMDINVTSRWANVFQEALTDLRALAALGKGDAPYTDYNHDDAAASSRPVEFVWGGDDKVKGGVRLRTKLTAKAKGGVKDGEWLRFSPSWIFDKNTFEPLGLDVNVGGLVNRAAFTTIAPVRARGTAQHSIIKDDMTTKELNEAIAAALKPVTDRLTTIEAKAEGRGAKAEPGNLDESRVTKLVQDALTAGLKPVIDAQEAQAKAAKDAQLASAKAAVAVHVGRGAIAPEDTATIEFWQNSYLANASTAESQMAKLPGKRLAQIIRGAGSTQTSTGGPLPEQRILAQAKDAKTPAERIKQLDGYLHTEAGKRDYEDYRNAMITGDSRFQTLAIKK